MPGLVAPSTLLVCTRCRVSGADHEAPRAGAALLAAAQTAARDQADMRVVGVACLSGCERACAAAILKGEGFAGNAGFGCIHRSPPAGPGERARLLHCIDEAGRIPLE